MAVPGVAILIAIVKLNLWSGVQLFVVVVAEVERNRQNLSMCGGAIGEAR